MTVLTFDQDGRQFSAQVEKRSGMAVQIFADFEAPWKPDMQYLVMNPENNTELYVDYPAMYRERIGALREYHNLAVAYANDKEWTPPEFGKYSDKYTSSLGRPPRAIELVVAAAQGNPWILGTSKIPDKRLVDFLERTTTHLEDDMSKYDFGADSYRQNIGGRGVAAPRDPFPRQTRFTSEADLAAAANLPRRGTLSESDPQVADDVSGDAQAAEALDDIDGFDVDEVLDDAEMLEDEIDPAGLGGRRVAPQNTDRAARQSPTPAGQKVKRRHRRTRPLGPAEPAPVAGGDPGAEM